MNNVKLDGPELWEIVFSATQGGGDEITEAQYSDIADTINAVFIAAKDAEIAKLKAALGPFADECDYNIGDTEDDSEAYSSRFGRLSVGDFRKAVAALTENTDADS